VGRFFDSDHWTTYRLGVSRPLVGILGLQLHGDVLRPVHGNNGGFAGLGTDLTVFRRPQDGPYLVAGLSGGLGSETSNSFSDAWGSWSAGVGYELFPASFLSVGAEGRYRQLSLGGRDGFELALGLTVHIGGSGSGPPARRPAPAGPTPVRDQMPLPAPVSPASAVPPLNLLDSVVATAREEMGRPYVYGGTGAGDSGFDCSGLIQYAYGKHGVQLPRRSVDQAREGKQVNRRLDQLRSADLLTFSNRGGKVTHVGLYIGGGEFIHSATRGVQISTLSPQDPYGRWWYQRWVGVRRIVTR
jgi:hypothetical protein